MLPDATIPNEIAKHLDKTIEFDFRSIWVTELDKIRPNSELDET